MCGPRVYRRVMFKKKSKKGKKRKRARVDLSSVGASAAGLDLRETTQHSDSEAHGDEVKGRGEATGAGKTAYFDVLAATRAEQIERKKRRSAITAGTSGFEDSKRRRRAKKVLGNSQADRILLDDDTQEDSDMKAYIAERMKSTLGKASINQSQKSESDLAYRGEPEIEDAYEILRRQKKTLAAEAGGASDIAGSGIAGIGIFEVSLPESERKRNIEATAAAVASALSASHSNSATGSIGDSLPSSLSGNYVKQGKLMYRQSAVHMADGKIATRGLSAVDKPRDREVMQKFRNYDRR